MYSDNLKLILINKIENVLYEIGFRKVTIKLATKTNKGKKELECYKYIQTYCLISFLKHSTISGTLKDWVLIEYAHNQSEASKWMFEDGDLIPLDLPVEQIVDEIKVEVLNAVGLNYN